MLVAYLAIVGAGTLVFLVKFILDLKASGSSGDFSLARDVTAKAPVSLSALPSELSKGGLFSFLGKKSTAPTPAVKPSSSSKDQAPKEELRDIKQALVDKLDQKCVKLEQILDEKNRILAQLQKDLENERAHRGEFESLKGILQQQINDFKAQNRSLKEELERALQENLRLQTGMVMSSDKAPASQLPFVSPSGDVAKERLSSDDYVRAEPDDVIPSHPLEKAAESGEGSDGRAPDSSLTLKDVFGEEQKPEDRGDKA
jgi:hypothetical protein